MKRRSARIVAIQSLYIIEMNQVTPEEALQTIIAEAKQDNECETDISKLDALILYVRNLLQEWIPVLENIDPLLTTYLQGWEVDRLSKVDRIVLRLAVFEMLYRTDIPPKVAVNEAIEIAKYFGTEESGKFVNGVLGKMIQHIDELKKIVT
jgi:N utilization substance protein B